MQRKENDSIRILSPLQKGMGGFWGHYKDKTITFDRSDCFSTVWPNTEQVLSSVNQVRLIKKNMLASLKFSL